MNKDYEIKNTDIHTYLVNHRPSAVIVSKIINKYLKNNSYDISFKPNEIYREDERFDI